jgi:hypothetical protein
MPVCAHLSFRHRFIKAFPSGRMFGSSHQSNYLGCPISTFSWFTALLQLREGFWRRVPLCRKVWKTQEWMPICVHLSFCNRFIIILFLSGHIFGNYRPHIWQLATVTSSLKLPCVVQNRLKRISIFTAAMWEVWILGEWISVRCVNFCHRYIMPVFSNLAAYLATCTSYIIFLNYLCVAHIV